MRVFLQVGATALHFAAQCGSVEVARLLIKAAADAGRGVDSQGHVSCVFCGRIVKGI